MTNSDFVRHMAVGHAKMQDTDYDAKIATITQDLQHLTGNQLDVISAFVTAMRRRSWGLSDEAPVPEQPEPMRDLPFMPQNGKWFGKGCQYQCCQWEDNYEIGGADYKEAFPSLIFCNHKKNDDDREGNCGAMTCPRWPVDDERPEPEQLGPCETLTPDTAPVTFLPTCAYQKPVGSVIKCDRMGGKHFQKACSKRCTPPVVYDGSTGKRSLNETDGAE